MNQFRPKILMSLVLVAIIGFAATQFSFAQDIGVSAINVRGNAQTGNQPILLGSGNNSIDVVVHNYGGVDRTATDFICNLQITWPNQVGGPLNIALPVTGFAVLTGGENIVTFDGSYLNLSNFKFDRKIIYTIDASLTSIVGDGGDINAANDVFSTNAAVTTLKPRQVAPAFNTPYVRINCNPAANADFTSFKEFGDYITASGLLMNMDVSVSSGTYSLDSRVGNPFQTSSTMTLDGSSFNVDNNFAVTIHGFTNYPQNVVVQTAARLVANGEPWIWKIKNINCKVQYITFTIADAAMSAFEPNTAGAGGQALYFTNSGPVKYSQEVLGCVFNGFVTPTTPDLNFASVYSDGQYLASFKVERNVFNNNAYGLILDPDSDVNAIGVPVNVNYNRFKNFTTTGIQVNRPATILPYDFTDANINNNVLQSNSFSSHGIFTNNICNVNNNRLNLIGTGGFALAMNCVNTPTFEPTLNINNNDISDSTYTMGLIKTVIIESQGFGGISVTGAKKANVLNNVVTIKDAILMSGINLTNCGVDLLEHYVSVQDNAIDMLANGCGFTATGSYVKAYYNSIEAAAPANASPNYGVMFADNRSIFANNIVNTTYCTGLYFTSTIPTASQDFYYNTIYTNDFAPTFNSDPTVNILLTNGKNIFRRNMCVNLDIDANSFAIQTNVPVASGFLTSDENNYYAASYGAGGILGNWIGTGTRTLVEYQVSSAASQDAASSTYTTANDQKSSNAPVIFDADGRLIYEFVDTDQDPSNGFGYYTNIFYTTPLFTVDNPLNKVIDETNFFGEKRYGYYAGYTNLVPVTTITTQPIDNTQCKGDNVSLVVIANTSHHSYPTYQWMKDGVTIVGATAAILNLNVIDWSTAGAYTCMVSGYGGALPVYSDTAIVVTVDKTYITRQPKDQTGVEHGSVVFDVQAHIRGFENDPTNNPLHQPTFQWYKVENGVGVALVDADEQTTDVVSGSKSARLTISNLTTAAWTQPIKVYVKMLGMCDYDDLANPVYTYSDTVKVTAPPTLTISVQPTNQVACEGTDATYATDVTTTDGVTGVTYQWKYKPLNGAVFTNLVDGAEIAGATTKTLIVKNLAKTDEGEFVCDITMKPGNVVFTTNITTLTVNLKPTIATQPAATLNAEQSKEFSLVCEGSGTGTITYQWKKDGADIAGQTSSTFTVVAAATTDAGSYQCSVTNECGTILSTASVVTVTLKEIPTGITDGLAGSLNLVTNRPNPFTENTVIYFSTPTSGSVKLVVTDLFGREVAVLVNQVMDAGVYNVPFSPVNIPSGIYSYSLTTEGQTITKQMVFVK